jgi:hypothetical protein
MSHHLTRFKKNILKVSDSKEYNEALKEWICETPKIKLSNTIEYRCICDHIIINGIFYRNLKNKKVIIIGSKCKNKFQDYISNIPKYNKKQIKNIFLTGFYKDIDNFPEYLKECFIEFINNIDSIDKLYELYEEYLNNDFFTTKIKEHFISLLIKKIQTTNDFNNLLNLRKKYKSWFNEELDYLITNKIIIKLEQNYIGIDDLIYLQKEYGSLFIEKYEYSIVDKIIIKLRQYIENTLYLDDLIYLQKKYKSYFNKELDNLINNKIRIKLKENIEKINNINDLSNLQKKYKSWFNEELDYLITNKIIIKLEQNYIGIDDLIYLQKEYESYFNKELDNLITNKIRIKLKENIEKSYNINDLTNLEKKYNLWFDEELECIIKIKSQPINELKDIIKDTNDLKSLVEIYEQYKYCLNENLLNLLHKKFDKILGNFDINFLTNIRRESWSRCYNKLDNKIDKFIEKKLRIIK